MWYDLPYFPYWKDPQGKTVLTDVVATRPKPVDLVYAQHMYAHSRRLKQQQRKSVQPPPPPPIKKKRQREEQQRAEAVQKRVLDACEGYTK